MTNMRAVLTNGSFSFNAKRQVIFKVQDSAVVVDVIIDNKVKKY